MKIWTHFSAHTRARQPLPSCSLCGEERTPSLEEVSTGSWPSQTPTPQDCRGFAAEEVEYHLWLPCPHQKECKRKLLQEDPALHRLQGDWLGLLDHRSTWIWSLWMSWCLQLPPGRASHPYKACDYPGLGPPQEFPEGFQSLLCAHQARAHLHPLFR